MNEHIGTPPHFKSFFMGGFECAYPKIEKGKRIDLLAETRHDVLCREDYKLLKQLRIRSVREGLAWSSIDKGNNIYDFSRFEKMMQIAEEEDIEQIWDLNHFDYPNHLDPLTPQFIEQFSLYAVKAVEIIRRYNKGILYIVPINEISFFTYISATHGVWAPYLKNQGDFFKRQLVSASIAAMDAVWAIHKNVRFIQVDPIFYRKAKYRNDEQAEKIAEEFKNGKFEAFDMLTGTLAPELGGKPQYLDIIGCNYYPYNQEQIYTDKKTGKVVYQGIPWKSRNRISVGDLLQEIHNRYKRPIVMSETGSWGSIRPQWWRRLLLETLSVRDRDLPVYAICAYPVIDRPDWTHGHLTNSGLWDFEYDDPLCERIPHKETISIIKKFINEYQPSTKNE